jgi:flagellar biogenesis protein FliO
MASRWILATVLLLASARAVTAEETAPSPPAAAVAAPVQSSTAVKLASAEEPIVPASSNEKLFEAPEVKPRRGEAPSAAGTRLLPSKGTAARESRPRAAPSPMEGWPSIGNVAGSLGIVVGVFLALVWGLRRVAPKTAGQLPKEAFEVLGRAPLAGRRQAQLIRCGPKLLLVSVAADEIETLTEITDPAEVDRLSGLCMTSHPTSASAAFRGVLDHFAKEPARGFLGRSQPDPFESLRRGDSREVRNG